LLRDIQATRPTWSQYAAPKFPVCESRQCLLGLLSDLHDRSESTVSLLRLPHIADEVTNYIDLCTPSLTLSSRQFVSMAPRKSRKTKTPANHEQPKTTPSINPQNQCPLFNLLPELRNMIYTYAVTRGPGTFFDRALASENLDSVYYKVYAYPPSSSLRNRIALLRTRRRINSEAANIFAADFGELTLVVDVSRARRHLDNYLIPQLDDDQMSRLIRIIVIVASLPPGTGWQHYVERIMPCGTPY